MTWHALHYPLKPGSETEVGDLFRASGRPRFDVTDDAGVPVGRLLGTMAFVGAGKAVRVIEVDGPLPQVAGHMSRQPEVREFETKLEEHLAVPRDMRSPDGARAFFRQAAMDAVQVEIDEQGEPQDWTGLFYPLLPGHEDAVRELAGAGAPPDLTVREGSGAEVATVGGMLFLVGREKAMRLVKVKGQVERFGSHMARQPAARAFQERLREHIAVRPDGAPAAGTAGFFAESALTCVLSRRHDRDV